MTTSIALGFIGAGNMAEAIARGVLRSALYRPEQLLAADPVPQRRDLFANELCVRTTESSAEVAAAADIILLAVKPQMIETALTQIKPVLRPSTLVISIVAAITTAYIEKTLAAAGGNIHVIRVMPNTPILVGSGMSALAKGSHATDEDLARAERIFSAGGKTLRVPETLLDAVTALSGSGPAYVFYLAETMAAAGAALGLPPADASLLARQTVIGAAKLLEESKDSPAELRRKVTSPGGTTHAAVETFAAANFPQTIAAGVAAAEKRAKELSR